MEAAAATGATDWDHTKAELEVKAWLVAGYSPNKIRNWLTRMASQGTKITNPGGWMRRRLEEPGEGPTPRQDEQPKQPAVPFNAAKFLDDLNAMGWDLRSSPTEESSLGLKWVKLWANPEKPPAETKGILERNRVAISVHVNRTRSLDTGGTDDA